MKKNPNPNANLPVHLNVCKSCDPVDVLTGMPDGMAVGIFAKKSCESTGNAQSEAPARVFAREEAVSAAHCRDPIYRCRHCGERIKMYDAVNYYGVPACPVCIHAGKPFELVEEPA